jgi:transcriptional regulator with XRE-family HTH domain
MTASLAAVLSYPLQTTITTRHSGPATSERGADSAPRSWRNLMTALTRSSDRAGSRAGEASLPASPPGVIGAAVIKAARHSAGLTRRRLARMITASPSSVRSWESGACPLFCLCYDQLCHLAAALDKAGATAGREVRELVLASQCDLLVTGMLHGFEDYAEVPPVDEEGAEGDAARDLLRWALTGIPPERYCPWALTAGPLMARQDLIAFNALAQDLNAGSHGDELASYGAALTALTTS